MSQTRITTAAIIEQEQRYFLALRKPGSSIGEVWEFPGGKNRYGETPSETLIRELKEEFNADISVQEMIFEGFFYNRGVKYQLQAFRSTLAVKNRKINLKLKEHQEYKWIAPKDFEQYPMADSDRMIAEKIRSQFPQE